MISVICKEPGCGRKVKALGICGPHYYALWRLRHGIPARVHNRTVVNEIGATNAEESKRVSLETELKRVRKVYEVAVGFECRMRWRRQITRLEAELKESPDE